MSPTKTPARARTKKTGPWRKARAKPDAKPARGERDVGDEAVAKATGRTWAEWFAALDRAGAAELDHKGIVALAAGRGAGPWWQQMVTVEYERARGLRAKHQRPDGFSVSRSVTLPAPVEDAFGFWNDAAQRERWIGKVTVRKATANKSMRITWCDERSSVEVLFSRKGPAKCQVAVQHSKLRDAREAERTKAYWGMKLEQMARRIRGEDRPKRGASART